MFGKLSKKFNIKFSLVINSIVWTIYRLIIINVEINQILYIIFEGVFLSLILNLIYIKYNSLNYLILTRFIIINIPISLYIYYSNYVIITKVIILIIVFRMLYKNLNKQYVHEQK